MTAPVSLISMANELNGLIEFFEKLFGLGAKGANQLRRRKAGKAADNLHSLHFPPGGFRAPLENIAAGKGSAADIDVLAAFYEQTSSAVVGGVQALHAYVDIVRKQCGAGVSEKLVELLEGPDGKFVIRYEIEGLVHMARGGRSTNADLQAQAKRILEMIAAFNAKLNDLHDTIFPPTGAPT